MAAIARLDQTAAMLRSEDRDRIRVLTLDRPDALNAFDEALYDATAEALVDAAADPGVAVVVLTGEGRAFCAGTDLGDMAARTTGGDQGFREGAHGFPGLVDQLVTFPKPLLIAVNGLALGIGATMLAFADLVFMSTAGRIRCPFTTLGVAPEAASSYTFPRLLGRQQAAWVLMSAEWFDAQACLDMGLVWKVCEPDELLPVTLEHAATLAAMPVSSLVETKRLMTAPLLASIAAAREGENAAFARLMGGPANAEALAAFMEKRQPDFTNLPPGW